MTCGTEHEVDIKRLSESSRVRSQGCITCRRAAQRARRGIPDDDLTGREAGVLTVLGLAEGAPKRSGVEYRYRCRCNVCGEESIKWATALRAAINRQARYQSKCSRKCRKPWRRSREAGRGD
jgi:hypothetical protein